MHQPRNEKRYVSAGYSEAQARLDFIDKFWIALGEIDIVEGKERWT